MDTPITDDYVISLLQKDTQSSNRLGSSFPASKRDKNAPKPNTRFLRNLVRDADSHNAALLAKEQAETRARLKGLERGGEKRGRDIAAGEEEDSARKRRREGEREGRWKGVLSGLGHSSAKDRHGRLEKRSKRDDREPDEKSRSHNHRRDEDRTDSRREHRSHRKRSPSPDSRSRSPYKSSRREHRRRRSHSRETTNRHPENHRRKRSRSRDRHGGTKRRSRSRSRSPRHSNESLSPKRDRKHTEFDSDSGPLDPLLGPAPPPTSRPRGRGANSTNSNRTTIDLRFNDANYNPRTDVAQSDSEGEGSGRKDKHDWTSSLEALRDRAAWREKGVGRLLEAGFGEKDVQVWEGKGREKDERDLKWRGKGEGREWDAGKVKGEEGVREKAAWTKGLE